GEPAGGARACSEGAHAAGNPGGLPADAPGGGSRQVAAERGDMLGRRRVPSPAVRLRAWHGSPRRWIGRVGWCGGGSGESGASRRSEEHTSELQSRENIVCRLLFEKKK